MKYMNRIGTFVLAFSVAWPSVGSDNISNSNNSAHVPREPVVAWSEIDSIIKRNPFKKEETISTYIGRLNDLNAPIGQNVLRFKPESFEQECLDSEHITNLYLRYGFENAESIVYSHKIFFHKIKHERDSNPLNVTPKGTLAFDEKRQAREVNQVIFWRRLPKELEKFLGYENVSKGQYLELCFASSVNPHFVYRKNREGNIPKQFPVIVEDLPTTGEPVVPIHFYSLVSRDRSGLSSDFIYIDEHGQYHSTERNKLKLNPLSWSDISKPSYLTRNGPTIDFYEAVLEHKVDHAPFIIEGKQKKGFYKVTNKMDTPEGVQLTLQRTLNSDSDPLVVTINGVQIKNQWVPPFPEFQEIVPVKSDYKWVLDISSLFSKMQDAEYRDLEQYLLSARLLGMDSLTLKCHPQGSQKFDQAFFKEVAIRQAPSTWNENVLIYKQYWQCVDKLIQQFEHFKWIDFDIVAGRFLVKKYGNDSLTGEQVSRVLSQMKKVQQIYLPDLRLYHSDALFQFLKDNCYYLTHLDLTGVEGLGASGDTFVKTVRELRYLQSLSVVKTDLTAVQCRKITAPYIEEFDYGKFVSGSLTELKMSLPVSAWPQSFWGPVIKRGPDLCDTMFMPAIIGGGVGAVAGIGYLLTAPTAAITTAAEYSARSAAEMILLGKVTLITSSLSGVAGYIQGYLWNNTTTVESRDSLDAYENIIRMKSLQRLVLQMGFNERAKNFIHRHFMEKREEFRNNKRANGLDVPGTVLEFMP